jgi:uncharacterized protein (TIGR00725 family)
MPERRPVIGIMGSGDATGRSLDHARELGTLVARRGWIVLTGGRTEGVMGAAAAGAKRVPGSLTLGILPGTSGGVGPDIDVAIFTGMGEARNAINVLTSDAIIACGAEGPGTASEISLALRADKPVILLGVSDTARQFFTGIRHGGLLWEVAGPEEAVQLLERELRIAHFTVTGETSSTPSD